MAAVVAEGVTIIHNAAREPDVVDLCTMLSQMGAQIEGAGTSTMTITGVPRLHRPSTESLATGSWPRPGESPRR